MIKLFKTENCMACKALAKELTKREIEFTEVNDINIAASLGIRSAPAIIKEDGSVLRTPDEIKLFLKK